MLKKANILLKEIQDSKPCESYRIAIKRMKEVIQHLKEPQKKAEYIKDKKIKLENKNG